MPINPPIQDEDYRFYSENELNAAYNNGAKQSANFWLVIGVMIGFIAGFGIAYIKLNN